MVRPNLGGRLAPGLIALAACLALSASPAQAEAPSPQEPTLDVTRYRIEGKTPLSDAQVAAILAAHVGEKRSIAQIEQAAKALEKAFRDEGHVFHRVLVPVQKPEGGEVVLQVLAFNLAKVTVSGNQHFSTENILRSLPALRVGEPPDMDDLGRDLTAANVNPSKQAAITFREGASRSGVDADLRVRDAEPLGFFAGLTANRSIDPARNGDGIYRLTVGVQHANLFDRDHVVTASYTLDPRDLGQVSLFGLYYQAPFYGTGLSLSGYYTYSDVNTGQVPQGGGLLDVSGGGEFMGVKLSLALPRQGTLQHTAAIALDDRHFRNDTRFAGTKITPDVGSRPISLLYTARQDHAWGHVSGNVGYARNFGGGADNRNANYAAVEADHFWDAWRYGVEGALANQGWNFTGKLRGQWSSHSLIPGEQFGLGGAGSVRGFADREVAGDFGYLWNLEAMAPQVLVPRLRPVIFIDGGSAHTRSDGHTERLASAGAGLRWSHDRLETSLDVARALDRNSLATDTVRTRLNFSAFYRF